MTRSFASLALLLTLRAVAWADISPNDISISSMDPEEAVSPIRTVEGPGVKIGEGTVIHPIFGLETGVVSNVFYEANNPTPAGLLRLLAQVGAGSLTGARIMPANPEDGNATAGDFQYRADLNASYDLMLSTDSTVQSTGGLGLGALLRGLANPAGRWSFGFDEQYVRLIRAANFETDANTNRDINSLALRLLYHPSDSAFGGYAYYNNTIDVFERSEQQFANRFQNMFGLHPEWRWLPQTTVFVDASIGIFTGLGSGSKKETAYPLSAVAGIATLLSLKTTFNVQAGYANGFYSNGASYSAPVVGAAIGYRYSPLGRVALTYDLTYQDSVNANYFRDHVVRLWFQQAFAPFLLMAQPEVHFRQYNGVSTIVMGVPPGSPQDTRDDVIISVIAGIHYNFRNWIAATLDYHFTDVSTDYMYPAPPPPGTMVSPAFVRHELLLGVRVAL